MTRRSSNQIDKSQTEMWWVKVAIQEYILRSWSLVKMSTTANQKKLQIPTKSPGHSEKRSPSVPT